MSAIRDYLRRHGGFWVGFAAVAVLTLVSAPIGYWLARARLADTVLLIASGSVVLIALLALWWNVRWARQRASKESSLGASPAQIVRVNERGRERVQTFVLINDSATVELTSKHHHMTIPVESIRDVTVEKETRLRPARVVVATDLFGPIEIIPLRSDGLVALPEEHAVFLAKRLRNR